MYCENVPARIFFNDHKTATLTRRRLAFLVALEEAKLKIIAPNSALFS
jgi:hypothetical protein